MKKLVFLLLLAVAMAGFVSAFDDAASPPGELSLETEIACVGAACGCPVLQVTAQAEAVFILSAGEYAISAATIENPVNLQERFAWATTAYKTIDTGQEANYYLLL